MAFAEFRGGGLQVSDEQNRRATDRSFDRELGELTAMVKQIGRQLNTHAEEGAKFREYQRERNQDILNEINALNLSSQLMQQKLDESSAQLNDHNQRLDEHDLERAKVKGALKAIGIVGLPGAGGLGAYLSKFFGS